MPIERNLSPRVKDFSRKKFSSKTEGEDEGQILGAAANLMEWGKRGLMPFPRFGNRFAFLLPAMIYCFYPRFMPFTFALLIWSIWSFLCWTKKVCWCCKIFLEICQTWWDTFCSKGTVSHMVFFFFYLFDVLLKIQRKTETNSSLLFPTPKKSWEKSRRRHRGRQISKSPIKRDLEQLGFQIAEDNLCHHQSRKRQIGFFSLTFAICFDRSHFMGQNVYWTTVACSSFHAEESIVNFSLWFFST